MKSFTMKALAVAVLGMAGMSLASAATCPTDPAQSGGGAWSAKFVASDASLAITSPGLNGTNCALSVSIGASSNSRVFVQDNSPQNEQRYRARFYVNLSNLTNFNLTNQTAIIFRANDTTAPAQFSSDQLVVRIVGGPGGAVLPSIRFFVADANQGSGQDSISVPLPTSASNTYRVEFDLQIGTGSTATGGCTSMPASGGCLRYWVTDAAAASTDAAPTGSITVNNSQWSGAKTSFLGLTTGTPTYRSNHAGVVIVEDEFDSRRQTFIGM